MNVLCDFKKVVILDNYSFVGNCRQQLLERALPRPILNNFRLNGRVHSTISCVWHFYGTHIIVFKIKNDIQKIFIRYRS